jgi:hypothetical protein
MSVNMSSTYYQYPSPVGNGFCYMGILPMSTEEIILGDVFMRGYIITFDRVNARMGFYNKGSSGNGSSGTSGDVFSTFDPTYFVFLQYIMGFFGLVMTVMGIGLWAMNKKVLNGKGFDSSLGKEMM